MIYSIFPSFNSTIFEKYPTQNTGKDSILELMKYAPSSSYDAYNSRILFNFSISEISQSISSGIIPQNAKFFLNLKCTEAYQLPLSYTIEAFAVSSSWQPGIGRFADDPINTSGVSWKYIDSLSDATLWITGSFSPNTTGSYAITPGGGNWYINYKASQSFDNQLPDINMDITDIFNAWIDGTIANNGIILKWDDSDCGIENVVKSLKFFSINSHAIFLPTIDIKWDDHTYVTESYSYSTQLYSASCTSQNTISYPTILLPSITSTFTYTTQSASYTIISSSISELTSSYINYTSKGIIDITSVDAISITGSLDGYFSGSCTFVSMSGSGSGYYNLNDEISYYETSHSISKTNVSGSYAGYFSGSLIMFLNGIISGSFSGSISDNSNVVYDKLYIQLPALNTYYYISGSQYIFATSSYILTTQAKSKETVIYPTNLKSYYKQDEKAIIQFNSRPRYPDKIYTTSSIYKKEYRLPETSYFCIKDASSEEILIDFDNDFTILSCGNEYSGNYFRLWMNGLQPERNYRILIKTISDNIEEIFDNKFIFKVVR